MLHPVREDTLGFHINQIKWMGYPFVFLLMANLTCVLYAVSRPATKPEAKTAQTVAEVKSPAATPDDDSIAVLSAEQSRQLAEELQRQRDRQTQATPDGASVTVSTPTDSTDVPLPQVEDPLSKELASIGSELVSSSPNVAAPHRWFSGLGERITSWQAQANADKAPEHTPATDESIDDQPPAQAELAATTALVKVRNPDSNRGALAFLANGELVTLKPDEEKVFPADSPQRIQFHRGGNFGNASYDLDAGVYEFAVTEKGWVLEAR